MVRLRDDERHRRGYVELAVVDAGRIQLVGNILAAVLVLVAAMGMVMLEDMGMTA